MLEIECDVCEVYLQPGEVYLARKPTIIRTILGSCVGIAFWSARLSVGALCHALLPKCPPGAGTGLDAAAGYRFVDFSIRGLARQFDQIGAARGEVQVKLFGGADVLATSATSTARPTIGRLNCEVALEVLRQEGLKVMALSLGGTSGRSIQFHTGNGEVRLRWISRPVFEEDTCG